MYGFLTNALKRRFMLDFRELINQHPEYKDTLKLVPRFPLKDRPQLFLHLTGNTTALQRLAPDNYLGEVVSFVQLFYVKDKPGSSLEWVKEDSGHLDQLVAPGVYYVTIVDEKAFTVTPLYEIKEQLYKAYISGESDPHFVLSNHPVQGHVDVIAGEEHGDSIFLEEGPEYTLDKATGHGEILAIYGPPGWGISARYWTPAPTVGPFTFEPLAGNNSAIPGVVLAFGRRAVIGDVLAVRIFSKRDAVAAALGGKWELRVDLDAWALDPDAPQEVMDFLALAVWGELFQRYATEGIAISEFNIGGEADEVYDSNTDQTWFMLNSSITALCDWEVHVPFPIQVSAIRGVTIPDARYPEGRAIVPIVQKPLLVSHSYDYERIR